jgi:hypothetical protein
MRRQVLAHVAVLTLLVGAPSSAQEASVAQSTMERRAIEASQVRIVSPMRVPMEVKIIKGAPYFADVVIESTQELPDGNRILNRTTGRVYRDGEGRVRREENRAHGQSGQGSITITDPVANVSVAMDPETKTAWRTASGTARAIVGLGGRGGAVARSTNVDPAELERRRRIEAEIAAGTARTVAPPPPPPAPAQGAAGGMLRRTGGPDWEEKTEQLPARQIEGVMAEGTRITRTIPAGAIGNEQPIVITSEEWVSPELQVLVMTRTSDPRTGESTYRLMNITRGEPNPSWFEIPPDYTVRESGVNRLTPASRQP